MSNKLINRLLKNKKSVESNIVDSVKSTYFQAATLEVGQVLSFHYTNRFGVSSNRYVVTVEALYKGVMLGNESGVGYRYFYMSRMRDIEVDGHVHEKVDDQVIKSVSPFETLVVSDIVRFDYVDRFGVTSTREGRIETLYTDRILVEVEGGEWRTFNRSGMSNIMQVSFYVDDDECCEEYCEDCYEGEEYDEIHGEIHDVEDCGCVESVIMESESTGEGVFDHDAHYFDVWIASLKVRGFLEKHAPGYIPVMYEISELIIEQGKKQ